MPPNLRKLGVYNFDLFTSKHSSKWLKGSNGDMHTPHSHHEKETVQQAIHQKSLWVKDGSLQENQSTLSCRHCLEMRNKMN